MGIAGALKARLVEKFKGPWLIHYLNVYLPYVGAGIRVRELGPLGFEASMALRPWNQNYLGTHFGGSLYSMCDPFFVLILSRNLGPAYEVWDKSAAIRYRRPGRGTVTARFEISREKVDELRAEVDAKGKLEAAFRAEVRDGRSELVAEIEKLVVLRARERSR